MSLEVSPNTGFTYLFDNVNEKMYEKTKNPLVFAILVSVVVIYVIFFNYLGVSHQVTTIKPGPGSKMIELILWAVFLFLIFVNALQYFFEIDFRASIKDLFGNDPKIDITVLPKKGFAQAQQQSEVFHIGDNIYTYNEAKILCSAHEGELASYEQIEDAYNKGAEWCSYGWSKDQMALFPTQKETYNQLKKSPNSKNNCGRPGINGGYIKNKNIKYGVNCYAKKGGASDTERSLMKMQQLPSDLPATQENKKLDFYRKNINKIVKKPFSSDKWSSF